MSVQNQWEAAESGVTRRIFQPGESLMLMEVHFEAGAEGAVHSHDQEQLTYCLEGQLEFTVDGVKTILTAGETLVIPSRALHGCRALRSSKLLDAFTPLRMDLLSRGE